MTRALWIVLVAAVGCGRDREPDAKPVHHEAQLVDRVNVTGGPFQGRALPCDNKDDDASFSEKRPLPKQRLEVAPFRIDRFVASCDEFMQCVAQGACTGMRAAACMPRDILVPGASSVAYLEWAQADAYCRWRGANLQSYAQWQRAVRGVDGHVFADGDAPPTTCTAAFTAGASPRCLHKSELGVEFATRDTVGGEWTRDVGCTGGHAPDHLRISTSDEHLDRIESTPDRATARCVVE